MHKATWCLFRDVPSFQLGKIGTSLFIPKYQSSNKNRREFLIEDNLISAWQKETQPSKVGLQRLRRCLHQWCADFKIPLDDTASETSANTYPTPRNGRSQHRSPQNPKNTTFLATPFRDMFHNVGKLEGGDVVAVVGPELPRSKDGIHSLCRQCGANQIRYHCSFAEIQSKNERKLFINLKIA